MPISNIYSFTLAREELIARMGNRTDITSRASRWLDSAQILIARSLVDCPDLIQMVNPLHMATNEVSLLATVPAITDVVGIISVRDQTNDVKLYRMPWWEYRDYATIPTANPNRWTRQAYQFAIDSIDDPVDLKIEYRRNPTEGVCEIDSVYQESWITLGEYIGWKALQRHNDAAAAFKLLPVSIAMSVSQPLTQEQWEAQMDPQLAYGPPGRYSIAHH